MMKHSGNSTSNGVGWMRKAESNMASHDEEYYCPQSIDSNFMISFRLKFGDYEGVWEKLAQNFFPSENFSVWLWIVVVSCVSKYPQILARIGSMLQNKKVLLAILLVALRKKESLRYA